MLKRCCPRTRRSLVRGIGRSAMNVPSALRPFQRRVSVFSFPRATVPSTSGRTERSSGQKAPLANGLYFGWSCMSWRQPARTRTRPTSGSLVFNCHHLGRPLRFEEFARADQIELRIIGFDAQEVEIRARPQETRVVEDRMIGAREAVQR